MKKSRSYVLGVRDIEKGCSLGDCSLFSNLRFFIAKICYLEEENFLN